MQIKRQMSYNFSHTVLGAMQKNKHRAKNARITSKLGIPIVVVQLMWLPVASVDPVHLSRLQVVHTASNTHSATSEGVSLFAFSRNPQQVPKVLMGMHKQKKLLS